MADWFDLITEDGTAEEKDKVTSNGGVPSGQKPVDSDGNDSSKSSTAKDAPKVQCISVLLPSQVPLC